jgi:hypothetical protein
MKPIFLIVFVLSAFGVCAQSNPYHFSLGKDVFNLVDSTERDSVLRRLDGFLLHKREPVGENPFIDPEYAKKNINPFEDLFYAEFEGNQDNFYKPTVLALLRINKNQEYVIKIVYVAVDTEQQAKIKMICTLVAKKRDQNYYIYNAIDYNTHKWSKQQVGSIYYVFPNKLDIAKARQMDRINHELAKKFSTPIIPVTYYRCDNPEQLFKMMGYDYIPDMYPSMSGGLAQTWNSTLLAGNDSELYVHELVHFYTAKLFLHYTRIMNEGYATYIGGSGGWSFSQLKSHIKLYLDQHPNTDITKAYVDFERIDQGPNFTYSVSALICKEIETKYGFKRIAELFNASNDEQYFKTLQSITGVSQQQFPDYVKQLVNNVN